MSHPFPAQAHFPEGTRLAVKEPYLKLSNAGTLTVRVDDPSNVVVLDRPGDGDEALVDPEALKARGKEVVSAQKTKELLEMKHVQKLLRTIHNRFE